MSKALAKFDHFLLYYPQSSLTNINTSQFEKNKENTLAKKSKIAKFNKQRALVEKYAALRLELKKKGDYEALAKLPKDSNPNRLKNRDLIDGRPHAYMRKFGMSRINFRNLAHKGQIPGVKKASW